MPAILLTIILIGGGGYLLTKAKTTSMPYDKTSPDHFTSSPSPTDTTTKNYTNSQYNFTIGYPVKSLSPENLTINCGNFIQNNNTTLFSPNQTIVLDNIAVIKVSSWDKSISDFVNAQGATGLYNERTILNSGADEAVSLNGFKKAWAGEGDAPLGSDLDIYKKNGMLFEVVLTQSFLNNGCINPSNKSWALEDHLRFN